MSTEIRFDSTLGYEDVAETIACNPDVRFLVLGPKGIGKSSLLNAVHSKVSERIKKIPELAETKVVKKYIDMATEDIGDTRYPVVDRERMVVNFAVNEEYALDNEDVIAVIDLDEFGKAGRDIQNTWHPTLEAKDPRFCHRPINPNTVIFLTSNLDIEGLGDNLKAHTRDRLCTLTMRGPTNEEWLTNFAIPNNLHPTVLSIAKERPDLFFTVLDPEFKDEGYKYQGVTPRGLERVSRIMHNSYNKQPDSVILASIAGCCGPEFAHDFIAYIKYQKDMPKWKDIMANPDKAKVPESQGVLCTLIFTAKTLIKTREELDKFMRYIRRIPTEWQAAFVINAANDKSQTITMDSDEFTSWLAENADIL